MLGVRYVLGLLAGNCMPKGFDKLLCVYDTVFISVEELEELPNSIVRDDDVEILQPHFQVFKINSVTPRVRTALRGKEGFGARAVVQWQTLNNYPPRLIRG